MNTESRKAVLVQGQRIPDLNNPELVNLVQKAEQYGQQRRFP